MARKATSREHLPRLGAEREGDLDIFMRHAPHVVGDQQHELEEGAEPEQEDLRLLADAEPDDRLSGTSAGTGR